MLRGLSKSGLTILSLLPSYKRTFGALIKALKAREFASLIQNIKIFLKYNNFYKSISERLPHNNRNIGKITFYYY